MAGLFPVPKGEVVIDDDGRPRGLFHVYLVGFCLVMLFSVLLPLALHNRAIVTLQDEVRALQDEAAILKRSCDEYHRLSERRHQEILTELRRMNPQNATPKGKP